tara:strand:- start:2664 stop:3050 length:387 start_codon:yes stop_codon:yes gene_type:complete
LKKIDLVIVDDETDIFKLYEVYLKKEVEASEVVLHYYEDGNELVKDFENSKFQIDQTVVLSDINMPAINGFDLLEKIKDRFDVAVYMVTAYNRDDYKQKAKNLGAIDLIAKPINFKELVKLLREVYLS